MWKRILLGAGSLVAGVGLITACGDDDDDADLVDPTRIIDYTSNMNTANEIPPAVGSAGTGTAIYTRSGRIISYTVDVIGLSDTAIAAHIHAGDSETNGPIIFPFTAAHVSTGQVASGIINLDQPIVSGSTSITGDSLLALFNTGNAYTNVHTPTFPNGEVRGQIIGQGPATPLAQGRKTSISP